MAFAAKADGCLRYIPAQVQQVTAPESWYTLVFGDFEHTIKKSFVHVMPLHGSVGRLGLDDDLNPLKWSDARLGDGAGDSAEEEAL